MSEPKTYLSSSEGKHRVIHQGMPISRDHDTPEAAMAAAKHYGVTPDPHKKWDGDKGAFESHSDGPIKKAVASKRGAKKESALKKLGGVKKDPSALTVEAKAASQKATEREFAGASDKELHGLHEKAHELHKDAAATHTDRAMKSIHRDEAKGHASALGMLKAGMDAGKKVTLDRPGGMSRADSVAGAEKMGLHHEIASKQAAASSMNARTRGTAEAHAEAKQQHEIAAKMHEQQSNVGGTLGRAAYHREESKLHDAASRGIGTGLNKSPEKKGKSELIPGVSAHAYSSAAHEASKQAESPIQRPGMDKAKHAVAGEAHLRAAEAHFGSRLQSLSGRSETLGKVREHLDKAAEHAKEAGGEWDEAKHPRDASGKFGG